MKIILVRHGETEENKAGIMQGTGVGVGMLSDLGRYQACNVAEKLKDENVDVIYSSDLPRAMNTAKKIHEFHDVDLVSEEGLREQNLGKYEGGSIDDYKKDVMGLGNKWIDFRPEGGETKKEFHDRVAAAFDRIIEVNEGKNIVLVGHGGSLFCLMHYLQGEPMNRESEYWHGNTGVTHLEKDGDKWKVVKFNDMEHLK